MLGKKKMEYQYRERGSGKKMGNRMYKELHPTMKSGDLGWEVMRSKCNQCLQGNKTNKQKVMSGLQESLKQKGEGQYTGLTCARDRT